MYELVIANKNYSSWSLRPWVLLRALGIPFSERQIPFPGGDSRPTYLPFSPSGRVPCLIDGETRVWDSLAIAEYLAERHEGVWPRDASARAWSRCAAAEMHSSFQTLRNICTMNCGVRVSLPSRPAALVADIARIDELWNEGLARFGGAWLAGASFTGVDAFFAPVAFRAQTYGLSFSGGARDYLDRLLACAPMREWYEAALAETWREAGHEEEARQAGPWTADFRAVQD